MATARELRGRAIAANSNLTLDEIYWHVPSETGRGEYLVNVSCETPTCTCPDYELSGLKCKHIYAVQYAQQCAALGVAPAETAKPKRPTYRQDWPAYNAAQTNEKALFQSLLHDLCQQIEEPRYVFGRPRHRVSDLVFAAAFKVYSTVSARRFACDLAEAHAKGYLSALPHCRWSACMHELTHTIA
jgi:hypothetical protein